MALNESLRRQQYFFRMTGRQLFTGGNDPARAALHSEGVPWLADAVAVDEAGGEVGGHLRGRQGDDAHVLFDINATGGKPLAEHEVMRGVARDRAEGETAAGAAADELFQAHGITHAADSRDPGSA
jgi:hypothetical protein